MKKLRQAKDSNWRKIAPRNVVDSLGWYAQKDDVCAMRVAHVINIGDENPDIWLRLSEALDFIEITANEVVTKSTMWCLTGAILNGVDPLSYWCDWEYSQRQ